MIFDDIVGQKNVVTNIKNAIKYGRTAHAYLFCGPDGVGKSTAASIFAAAVNCKAKMLDPCGRCSSCIKAQSGNHPDIIHFRPRKHSGSKESIAVDDIRDLQMDMLKKPYEDGKKVYIIHDAQKMTEQAQNALLKTLEEPPEHTLIIMLADNMYSLLKTIMSRCQILKFTRAPERDIERYLIDKMSIPKEEAKYISAFSDGILGKAMDFIEDEQFKNTRNEVIDLAAGLYKCDKFIALSKADYFLQNRERIDNILDVMMSFFRDMLIYKECGDKGLIINLDKENIIQREYSKYTTDSLYNIIDCIKKTAGSMKYNINFQLAIEAMLLKLQEG